MYQDIQITHQQRIGILNFNRPNVLNAIRIQTYNEIINALEKLNTDNQTDVVIITGNEKCFCAGNDLSDLVGDDLSELNKGVKGIFAALTEFKKPLLLAQEGVAVGIGANLILHADMVFAGKNTRYSLPFANLGVASEGASAQLLSQHIGEKNARELLFSGRFFNAEEAKNWGLINHVEEDGKALDAAIKMAQNLCKQSQPSLLAIKNLMKNEAQKELIEQTVEAEMQAFTKLLATEDTKNRIQALINKAKS